MISHGKMMLKRCWFLTLFIAPDKVIIKWKSLWKIEWFSPSKIEIDRFWSHGNYKSCRYHSWRDTTQYLLAQNWTLTGFTLRIAFSGFPHQVDCRRRSSSLLPNTSTSMNHVLFKVSLTHWGRDKMAAIFQTTFSNAFPWMKMCEFRLRFHWILFPMVQLTTLVQIMAWLQPGDKPLSEPMMVSLLTHICITRPQYGSSYLIFP